MTLKPGSFKHSLNLHRVKLKHIPTINRSLDLFLHTYALRKQKANQYSSQLDFEKKKETENTMSGAGRLLLNLKKGTLQL